MHYLLLAGSLLFLTAPGYAQSESGKRDFDIPSVSFRVDLMESALVHLSISGDLLRILRDRGGQIHNEAAAESTAGTLQANAVRNLLAALGPAPEKDGPPEDPAITERRKRLKEEIGFYEGRQKQANLILVRVQQVLSKVSDRLRDRRTRELFERGPSPLCWSVPVRTSCPLSAQAVSKRKIELL